MSSTVALLEATRSTMRANFIISGSRVVKPDIASG
jgi:hypothetical protein